MYFIIKTGKDITKKKKKKSLLYFAIAAFNHNYQISAHQYFYIYGTHMLHTSVQAQSKKIF